MLSRERARRVPRPLAFSSHASLRPFPPDDHEHVWASRHIPDVYANAQNIDGHIAPSSAS